MVAKKNKNLTRKKSHKKKLSTTKNAKTSLVSKKTNKKKHEY